MKNLVAPLCWIGLLLGAACGGSSAEPDPAEPTRAPVAAAETGEAATAEPAEGTEPGGSEEGAAEPEEPEDPADPAPDFTLPNLAGEEVSLSDHRGKTVVLEWFNPGCPFVKYAHGKGPLKEMPKEKMDQGIVWLAINSNAPGKQGHGVDRNKKAKDKWSMPNPVLVDESGEVGKAYGAKTTPHMFIIDERGGIVYRGALDNAPAGKVPDEGHVNYVEKALADLEAGRPIEIARTQAYGCSVKYAE